MDTDELNDDQTFNTVNELTARDTDDNGTDNYTLTYDAAGNLTDDGKDYEWVYDAFGRLVEVQNQSQQTVAEYSYNGLGYRTGWHHDVNGDGTVEANTVSNTEDPWFQFVYDTGWWVTATYRASHYSTWTIDANPKEKFVNHAAGLVGIAGSGGSSYIDSVIRRDRDANTNWEAQADAMLEERTYTCQNWRADVVALMTSGGVLVNQVRYDPYGKPFGIAKTDLDADGDVDTADYLKWLAHYNSGSGTHPYADWNWDGSTDSTDNTAYAADRSADTGIGRGALGYAYSHANGASRKGYAGYEVDPVLTGSEGWESIYHIRHRVLLSQLGRWTHRDPLGYVDGMSVYTYVTRVVAAFDPTGLRPYLFGDNACGGIGGPGDSLPGYPWTPLPPPADTWPPYWNCAHNYDSSVACHWCCDSVAARKGLPPEWTALCYGACDDKWEPPHNISDCTACSIQERNIDSCQMYPRCACVNGINVRCMCECMGTGASFERFVRGCLQCMLKVKQGDWATAHHLCYLAAGDCGYPWPYDKSAACGAECAIYQLANCPPGCNPPTGKPPVGPLPPGGGIGEH